MMSADAKDQKQTILTVLSVDDSLISQQMIKRALDASYRVLLADNAVDALSVIYQEPITALLLDISMPGIDGFELCRTVRSLPQFKIIFSRPYRSKIFWHSALRVANAMAELPLGQWPPWAFRTPRRTTHPGQWSCRPPGPW
jgi:CheY-like chemotaxis protein